VTAGVRAASHEVHRTENGERRLDAMVVEAGHEESSHGVVVAESSSSRPRGWLR